MRCPRRLSALPLVALAVSMGCADADPSLGAPDGAALPDADAPDAGPVDVGPYDAAPDLGTPDAAPLTVAPPGLVPGEQPADASTPIHLTPSASAVFRLEVEPGEHVGFFLRFSPTAAKVVLEVERYDGAGPVRLGSTNAGPGIRTLAVFEADAPRTHWVRLTTTDASFDGTLEVVRTPFADGARCSDDCARLLQLPLPVASRGDGYALTSSTVLRYQFGRRDLLMFVRHAAHVLDAEGYAPFVPEDFSQWDGATPGTDTGSLRHASHQRGKDVDLSLYGTDGTAPWRSYCTVTYTADGRECVPATRRDFDGFANAVMMGALFDSGRVTMSFLDRELVPAVVASAPAAIDAGLAPAATLPLYGDGVHLMHWPNHDNHVHVRVSEATGSVRVIREPVFEAP